MQESRAQSSGRLKYSLIQANGTDLRGTTRAQNVRQREWLQVSLKRTNVSFFSPLFFGFNGSSCSPLSLQALETTAACVSTTRVPLHRSANLSWGYVHRHSSKLFNCATLIPKRRPNNTPFSTVSITQIHPNSIFIKPFNSTHLLNRIVPDPLRV